MYIRTCIHKCLLCYVDGLEFDFFLTHQLFIPVSELCNAMMQKYPSLVILPFTFSSNILVFSICDWIEKLKAIHEMLAS